MKRSLIVFLCLMLAACDLMSPFRRDPPVLESIWPDMPADVRRACDLLPPAPAKGSNMGHLLVNDDVFIGLYEECALRNDTKLDWYERTRPKPAQ